MTEVFGGKRKRYIKDNIHRVLDEGLTYLEWFDADTAVDVELIPERLDTEVEIKPNKIAISTEDFDDIEIELGSTLTEDSWDIYIDIYAESEDIGIELVGDCIDILRGKIPGIGNNDRTLDVYNPEVTFDEYLFSCDIANIAAARVKETSKPYLRYYWAILCTIEDSYY